MDSDDADDSYPQARPPRKDEGCPACGADLLPTKVRALWPQHPVGGLRGAEKCGLSGYAIGYETDRYFRTFFDRENPDTFPKSGYQITTELGPYGDAIGFTTRVSLETGHHTSAGIQVVEVTNHIVKDDYPRLRAELDRLARQWGWIE